MALNVPNLPGSVYGRKTSLVHAEAGLGHHFTYFFQHETSHEDNNLFQLIDNGAQVRFTLRF